MTHNTITRECEALGLRVEQTPDTGAKSFQATRPGIRVYWRTSTLGGLLGLPRVVYGKGIDTHARSLKEIRYLVLL